MEGVLPRLRVDKALEAPDAPARAMPGCDPQHAGLGARGRNGRRVGSSAGRRQGLGEDRRRRRVKPDHGHGWEAKLQLFIRLGVPLGLLLSLVGLSFLDEMTQPTRVFPVEGNRHRLGQGCLPAVFNQHAHPGDRLQKRQRGSHC